MNDSLRYLDITGILKSSLFGEGEVVFFILDKNLFFKEISKNIQNVTGYSQEEIIAKNMGFFDIIHEDDVSSVKNKYRDFFSRKGTFYIHCLKLRSKDNKEVYVSCRAIHIKEGKKDYFVGYLLDKTKEVEGRSLFETISKVAPVGIFLKRHGRLIFVNKKVEEITEYSEKELLDMDDILMMVHPDDRRKVEEIMELRNKGIRKLVNYRIKLLTKTNRIKWIHVNSETVSYQGEFSGIGTVEDVTREVHLEKAKELLFRVNRLIMKINEIDLLLKSVVDTLITVEDFSDVFIAEVDESGKIFPKYFDKGSVITELFNKLDNIPENEVLNRMDYFYIKDVEEIEDFERWKDYIKTAGAGSVLLIPVFIHDRIKYVIFIYAREKDYFFDEEISIYREISDDVAFGIRYIQQQKDLFHKEFFDTLTGLGNRKLLLSELKGLVKEEQPFYLVFLDIYNFRFINEIYGEKVGDILLREIANTLKEFLDGYKIFRSGSDTFTVVVRDSDIMSVLEKVKLAFTIPFSIEDHIIHLDFNVSVVKYPEDGKTESDIYIKGERTLELSKSKGKNHILFYNEKDYQKVKTIKEIEEKIETALIENQFTFNLQPVVDFKTDSVVAAEALIRWKTPEGEYIPPSEFIPVAEKTGQIRDIDNLMLVKVNDVINRWKKKGLNPVKISVNVTPQNIEEIIYKIKSTNKMVFFRVPEGELLLNSKYIIMEITERDLLDLYRQKKDIDNLREMGFEISIDDFGTGFSTLKYLANINVDSIKIDMSFIKDMLVDENVHKLVQSIINIAKIFNIKTIAEGVETEEQYLELKKLGCDRYQGYYFSPPLEPEEFERFLK
ncbi:sensor domain-containing protein [Persephonella sp.]